MSTIQAKPTGRNESPLTVSNAYGLPDAIHMKQPNNNKMLLKRNLNSSLGLKRNSTTSHQATRMNQNRDLVGGDINRSVSRSRSKNNTMGARKQSQNFHVFTIGDEPIPDRNTRIKPDQSRSYLSDLPVRYEYAKMKNVITRSVRNAAAESKQILDGQCQVYTG